MLLTAGVIIRGLSERPEGITFTGHAHACARKHSPTFDIHTNVRICRTGCAAGRGVVVRAGSGRLRNAQATRLVGKHYSGRQDTTLKAASTDMYRGL